MPLVDYYNEFDPNAAAWIRELIAAGLVPEGVVDEKYLTSHANIS